MSTRYYLPHYPITHLAVKQEGKRHNLNIWLNGQLAGTIRCSRGELLGLLEALSARRKPAIVQSDNGRLTIGTPRPRLDDTLISDKGELTALWELRQGLVKELK